MKVYQLKIDDLNLVLDPVFKTKEGANLFSNKYLTRNVSVIERAIDKISDFVYRIELQDEEGTSLADEVFSSADDAKNFSLENKFNNSKIVKENIINGNHDYELIEI